MTKRLKQELLLICTALFIFLLLLALEHGGLLPDLPHLAALLYLIPYLICGLPVLKEAARGVRNRQPFDEAFLMALASIGAFATGEAGEAVAVMLFYQLGEWFQRYAVGRSRRSITDLMKIMPEYADIERPDGSIERIDPEEVRIGDRLVIRPGDRVPVDGIVRFGNSMLNTAALTGESVPRAVHPGEPVISGCINGEGLLKIEAVKLFSDSTVSRILELVEEASEKKSKTESFITRFARVYTPIVVYLAIALAILPGLSAGMFYALGLSEAAPDIAFLKIWLYRACTFLVVSCPCALVISVPLAFFGGIGAASRNGVLVKGSNYLELLSGLSVVVSDKTGTLTEGVFKVQKLLPEDSLSEWELLRLAASGEALSTHPIAGSIRERWQELAALHPDRDSSLLPLENTENLSGQGVRSVLLSGGRPVVLLLGSRRLMEEQSISFTPIAAPEATVLYLARDGHYAGALLISDSIKPYAAEAISSMKASGVEKLVLLSGDRREVAEAAGRQLGIDEVHGELMPEDKLRLLEAELERLSQKKNKGRRFLAFLGDGINDAPSLSRADVGIAMGAMGSDAAIEAADVVLMDDDLRRLPAVFRIAGKTVRIASQNIAFALLVKLFILLLSALGLANMWAAVFADVGVAVLCILNSMRLLREK